MPALEFIHVSASHDAVASVVGYGYTASLEYADNGSSGLPSGWFH
jgi:hypothetical protein